MAHLISAIDYRECHLGEGDFTTKMPVGIMRKISRPAYELYTSGALAEAFGFHGRRRRAVVVDSAVGRFSAQERKIML